MGRTDDLPKNFKDLFARPLELMLFLLLLSIATVTFAQVVSRYLLEISLSWSEEAARFLMIWLGFISAGYAFKDRSHFSLTFFVDKFSARVRYLIKVIGGVVQTAFVGLFIVLSVFYLRDSVAGMTSPGLGISFVIPYSAALFGGCVMIFYIARNVMADIRQGIVDDDAR